MKYKIYEMIQPSHLKEIVSDGYDQKTIQRNVLEEVEFNRGWSDNEYDSIEEAMDAIRDKGDELKFKTLTILPIVYVNYDGEVD